MQVFHGIRQIPPSAQGAVLAIGNFDGVHRGHQALLRLTLETARRLERPAGVLVFEPHPRRFFQPETPHFELTPLPLKLRLLSEFGLDFTVVLPFDAALAALSAGQFVRDVLLAAFKVAHVVVGYNFCYGQGRGGTGTTMQDAGERLGFGVSIVPPVTGGGKVCSSSAIRQDLAKGDVESAAGRLGRYWRVSGTVISGAGRGGGLGFPTANLALPPGTALAHGIYAARVFFDGIAHDAAAYFGTRPTFDGGEPFLEVYLLGYEGALRGREIEVEFAAFIREDRSFPSTEALQAQMADDCVKVQAALAAQRAGSTHLPATAEKSRTESSD